jgi:hypothetical protein
MLVVCAFLRIFFLCASASQRSFLFSAPLAESPQPSRRARSGDWNRAGARMWCLLPPMKHPAFAQQLAIPPTPKSNCREGVVFTHTPGSGHHRSRPKIAERFAPVLSRSLPTPSKRPRDLIGSPGRGRPSREDGKGMLPTGRGPSDYPASAGVGDCIAVFRRFEEKKKNSSPQRTRRTQR